MKLVILGSGAFALETLDIAEAAGQFQPAGFVNSLEIPQAGTTHGGLPVFGIDSIPYAPAECLLVGGIISTKRRAFIEVMLARGFEFASVIHPSAIISPRSKVANGCVVNAGVIISQNTDVSAHTILNRGCLIGHDNHIGSFCTIGPGANLAGGIEIGDGTFIGIGAIVRDHISIGVGSMVGAGSVVVKPVPDHVLVAGVPARVSKTGIDGM